MLGLGKSDVSSHYSKSIVYAPPFDVERTELLTANPNVGHARILVVLLSAEIEITAQDPSGTAGSIEPSVHRQQSARANAAGTYLLSDIRPGPDTSYPEDFVVANGLLFFSADDGVNGREVWRSDGTVAGTYMLADIAPGAASGFVGTTVTITGSPSIAIVINVVSRYPIVSSGPYVYFIASDGPSGAELWRSDGTASGTIKLTDLAPADSTTTTIQRMTAFGSRLAFTAIDPDSGEELWLSDGTRPRNR